MKLTFVLFFFGAYGLTAAEGVGKNIGSGRNIEKPLTYTIPSPADPYQYPPTTLLYPPPHMPIKLSVVQLPIVPRGQKGDMGEEFKDLEGACSECGDIGSIERQRSKGLRGEQGSVRVKGKHCAGGLEKLPHSSSFREPRSAHGPTAPRGQPGPLRYLGRIG